MSEEFVEKLPDIFEEQEPGYYVINLGYTPKPKKIRDISPPNVALPRKFCEFVYQIIKGGKSVDYTRNVITCGRQFFGYLQKYKPEIYKNHYIISKTTAQEVFDHCVNKWKLSISTIQLQDANVYSYYKWLKKQVEEDVFYFQITKNAINAKLLSDVQEKATKVFIAPLHEIISLRNTRGVSLQDALGFEFLLSTGLRSGECFQLQTRDINLDETCNDIETGMPSIYFRGSVSLHRVSIRAKSEASRRKVYMSLLARELMIRWYRFKNLKSGTQDRIFQPAREICVFDKISSTFYLDMLKKYKPHLHAIQEAGGKFQGLQDYMSQVAKDDAAENSDSFNEALEKKNINGQLRHALAKQEVDSQDKSVGDITVARDYKSLWPHYMRHVAGMLMYYRCQNGARFNLEEARRFMGHSYGSRMLTNVYTSDYSYIQSDDEWEKAFKFSKLGWIEARAKALNS